jgi:hypothetical protein
MKNKQAKKETFKVTEIKNYQSNAKVWAINKLGENGAFNIDFDYISLVAKRNGGDALKRAIIKRLRYRYSQYKFIVPSSI